MPETERRAPNLFFGPNSSKFLKMGNTESADGQGDVKPHVMQLRVPMPDSGELEERFALVLVSKRVASSYCQHLFNSVHIF